MRMIKECYSIFGPDQLLMHSLLLEIITMMDIPKNRTHKKAKI